MDQGGQWDKANWSSVLSFLAGDCWKVTVRTDDRDPLAAVPKVPAAVTRSTGATRCLFSDGLNCLCGVVELLDRDPVMRL